MAFSDILNALKGAPTDIRAIDKQLAKLKAERLTVSRTGPDAAAARAWFKRRFAGARASAIERLTRWHINKDSFAHWTGETFDSHAGFNALGLTTTKPHPGAPGSDVCAPNPAGDHVDTDMLLFLIGPAIESQLDALFDEHVAPLCANGVPSAKREARLADLDAKIRKLEADRAELVKGVEEAQRHLAGNVVPQGVSDADVAREVAEYERATSTRVEG